MKIIVEHTDGVRVEIANPNREQEHIVSRLLASHFDARHKQALRALPHTAKCQRDLDWNGSRAACTCGKDRLPTLDDALAERAIAAMQDFTPGNQPAPAAPKKQKSKKKGSKR